MPSKQEIRVALTRTAVGHWERYFSLTAAAEQELEAATEPRDQLQARANMATYKHQLTGTMAAVRSLARCFNVAIMTNEQLRAKGLETYRTNQRRTELEHRTTT